MTAGIGTLEQMRWGRGWQARDQDFAEGAVHGAVEGPDMVISVGEPSDVVTEVSGTHSLLS